MLRKVFLFSAIIFFASCNKEEFKLSEELSLVSSIENIVVKNGMLVFPDTNSLFQVINGEVEIPSRLNFTSQNDIYNNILREEEKFADATRADANVPEHCHLYNENVKSGFLKITRLSDGNQFYDVNLYSPQYACVANKEGFFAVGNDIYQVTSEYLKIWKDGDIDSYYLLKNVTSTDKTVGIVVYSDNDFSIQTRDVPPFTAVNCDKIIMSEYAKDIKYYFHVFDKVSRVTRPPIVSYERTTYMKFVAQKKSGTKWVYWNDANTALRFTLHFYAEGGGQEVTRYYNKNVTGATEMFTFACYHDPLKQIFQVIQNPLTREYTTPYLYLSRYNITLRDINNASYKTVEGYVKRAGTSWIVEPTYTNFIEVSLLPE